MGNLRIRYGRPVCTNCNPRSRCEECKSRPKSTLLTMREGDDIFFGISKCNPVDHWSSKEGKRRAQRRLDLAMSDKPKSFMKPTIEIVNGDEVTTICTMGELSVHSSGLFGKCPVDQVKNLLQYFDSVTCFLPTK